MKEIFISYSVIDTAPAETVRSVLEKNGLSCWMAPRDIPGGSNYTKEIPIAIRNCKVFLLILSQNSQRSPWVLKELDSAVNSGKVILPFMLEEFQLSDEFNFLLTGAQRYAAYQKKAEVMEQLILRLRSILEPCGEAEIPEVLPEPEPEPETAPEIFLGETKCVACGSSDLKPLPRKMIRQGASELATLLLIPLMAAAMGFLLMVVAGIFFDFFMVFLLLLCGIVGGGIAGNHLSKTLCRRWQIRSHVKATCYKCCTCSKVFRHNEPFTF